MGDDTELEAIGAALMALSKLEPEAQARGWIYIGQRLGINSLPGQSLPPEGVSQQDGEASPQMSMIDEFASFAELHDRTRPDTQAISALVAGYWLQVCGAQADFEAFYANKELQHLGHKLPNVTKALTDLKNMKPSLAMQVRKSGKSAQARKRYRLTGAGIKYVEELIKKGRV